MSGVVIVAGDEADVIAAAIRREHAAASAAAGAAVAHALEAGRLLAQARAGTPHGGWESFVRDSCGIAPRTARLYLQLDANRERIANRQRDAGLTVREAARLVAEPKAAKATHVSPLITPADTLARADIHADEGRGTGPRFAVPEWYRPGHSHAGSHPAGWCFKVWPTRAGEPWVHYFICSASSGYPGEESGTLVGPKRGIRIDAIVWAMEMQSVNGMPTLDDPAWRFGSQPVDLAEIAAQPDYNSWLFRDEEDYRRRGMGLMGRRRAAAGARA